MQILPIVLSVVSAAGGALATYSAVENRAKTAFKQAAEWQKVWKSESYASDRLRDEVSSLKLRLATFEEKAKATSVKRAAAGRLGAAATNVKRKEKRAAAVARTLAAIPSIGKKSSAGVAATKG